MAHNTLLEHALDERVTRFTPWLFTGLSVGVRVVGVADEDVE